MKHGKRVSKKPSEQGSNLPRLIIVKFQVWKKKEKVVCTARKMKPDKLMFSEDFAQRTLQHRRELILELIRKRKQGKQAYIVMDRIVEYDIDEMNHSELINDN